MRKGKCRFTKVWIMIQDTPERTMQAKLLLSLEERDKEIARVVRYESKLNSSIDKEQKPFVDQVWRWLNTGQHAKAWRSKEFRETVVRTESYYWMYEKRIQNGKLHSA